MSTMSLRKSIARKIDREYAARMEAPPVEIEMENTRPCTNPSPRPIKNSAGEYVIEATAVW